MGVRVAAVGWANADWKTAISMTNNSRLVFRARIAESTLGTNKIFFIFN